MKNWFLHILLLAGLFGMLTTSCSQDEEDLGQDVNNGRVLLNFTIVLDDNTPASRTWGSNENASNATPAENVVNSLQILLFKSDGSEYYGTLENVQYFSVHSQDKIYEIQGSMPLDVDDLISTTDGVDKLNCKIMALANCSVTIEKGTAIADVLSILNAKTFNISDIYTTADGLKTGIPMWGITAVNGLSIARNFATSLDDDIYLLRSMAKIEVKLSDNVYNKDYRITGATLNNYNTQGYVVPAFMIPETDESTQATTQTATLSGLSKTTDLLTNGVYRPITDQLVTTGKDLSKIDNNKTYVIYVPEMAKGTDAAPNKVSLQLGRVTATAPDGTETITDITSSVMNGTPHIVLKDYAQGGSHFDITRNHWYKYTINSINDGIEATLTVKPSYWTAIEDYLDYSGQVSVEDNPDGHIKWFDADGNRITGDNVTEYMTIVNSLTCKFQLATPQYATWEASFIPVEGSITPYKFETTIKNADGTETIRKSNTISGIIENGKEAELKIVPTSTTIEKNNIAILRIIVSLPNGNTIHVKELTGKDFIEYKIVQYK